VYRLELLRDEQTNTLAVAPLERMDEQTPPARRN
jgi:hypothetical protein